MKDTQFMSEEDSLVKFASNDKKKKLYMVILSSKEPFPEPSFLRMYSYLF